MTEVNIPCENCNHKNVCENTFDPYYYSNCEYYEKERPHGSWEGKPESKLLITRRCTACGERGVVGNFCWLCGSDNRKRGETE